MGFSLRHHVDADLQRIPPTSLDMPQGSALGLLETLFRGDHD